jgi:hypothetical protein
MKNKSFGGFVLMNYKAFIVIIDEDHNEEKIPVISKDKIKQFREELSKCYSEDLY